MTQMMYHLFSEHGVMPSVIYNLKSGEYNLAKAFFQIEMENEENRLKAIAELSKKR